MKSLAVALLLLVAAEVAPQTPWRYRCTKLNGQRVVYVTRTGADGKLEGFALLDRPITPRHGLTWLNGSPQDAFLVAWMKCKKGA